MKTPQPTPSTPSQNISRRWFIEQCGVGLGAIAANSLLAQASYAANPETQNPLAPKQPHFPAKAKRVIFLFMHGGPSSIDTFDPKERLVRDHGKPLPIKRPLAFADGPVGPLMKPLWQFKPGGQSGIPVSDLFPHVRECVDDMCIIRSMHTEAINHDPAHTFMNTGSSVSGRPSMGSWLTYGIGAEAEDLPGFVVLTSNGRGGQNQPIASRQWGPGFLPGKFQGVHLRGQGDPILYLTNPPGVAPAQQRDVIDAVSRLNQLHGAAVDDPEVATRIAQYELAFKMQTSVPALMDLSAEPRNVLDSYGTKGGDGSFAANCLLARRLAQRGVRFIQLYHRDWDHHGGVKDGIKLKIEEVDKPLAALIQDLKRLGMFDDTLIVFTGEFGRTPMSQGGNGRDHHMKGFSALLAGGGIKGGVTHGATDDFGYHAAENIVEVFDLHATMLHLLGIDHERLTFRFQGRDYRLTDVHGKVVREILA